MEYRVKVYGRYIREQLATKLIINWEKELKEERKRERLREYERERGGGGGRRMQGWGKNLPSSRLSNVVLNSHSFQSIQFFIHQGFSKRGPLLVGFDDPLLLIFLILPRWPVPRPLSQGYQAREHHFLQLVSRPNCLCPNMSLHAFSINCLNKLHCIFKEKSNKFEQLIDSSPLELITRLVMIRILYL